MTQRAKKRRPKLLPGTARDTSPKEALDVLLALDRMLVEVSMYIYNIPPGEQLTMRNHNRQLHDVFRANLPRVLKHSRHQP